MDNQIPLNNVAIVGGVFGALLLGMLLLEVVQPLGKKTEVATGPPANAGREGKPPSAKSAATRTESDDKEAALVAWEAFVNRVKAACDKYNNDPTHKSGGTSNFVRFKGEAIKKSESLRYLFEGELIIYEVFHFKTVYVEDVRWHFGWKGGKWEYKDSTSQRIKTPGGPTDPAQLDEHPRPVTDRLLQGEKKKLILDCLQ